MAASVFSVTPSVAMVDKLAERVGKAKTDDPFQRCTILVPSLRLAHSARRRLGQLATLTPSDGGKPLRGLCVNLDFETPVGLALEMVRSAGVSFDTRRRLISTKLLAACLQVGKSRNDPSLVELLHPLAFPTLERAYRQWRESPKQSRPGRRVYAGSLDVTSRCAEVEKNLAALSIWDETDLFSAAAGVMSEFSHTADLGHVIVYLPQLPPAALVDLYRALALGQSMEIIVPLTGEPYHDTAMEDWLRAIGSTLPSDEGSAFRSVQSDLALGLHSVGHVLSVSDPDEEVRVALRELSLEADRFLQDNESSTRGFSAAILYGRSDPYQRIIHEQLGQGDYRFNGDALMVDADPVDSLGLGERVGLMLSAMLALLSAEVPRRDLVSWVERFRPHVVRRPLRAEDCELATRILGSKGTLDEMAQAANHYLLLSPQEQRRLLRDHVSSASATTSSAVTESVEGLLALLEVLADALQACLEITDEASLWRWCTSMTDALCESQEGVPFQSIDVLAVSSHAAEDRSLVDHDEWGWVGEVAFALEHCKDLDLAERRDVFVSATRPRPRSLGRYGTGVFVGTLAQARYLDFDFVAIVGLNEGTLPQALHLQGGGEDVDGEQYSDLDRTSDSGTGLVVGDCTTNVQSRRDEERHRMQMSVERGWVDLVATISLSASWRLLWSRGSLRSGSPGAPSRYLRRLEVALRHSSSPLVTTTLPSAYFSLRTSVIPSNLSEFRLRTLLNHSLEDVVNSHSDESQLFFDDRVYRLGRELRQARRSSSLTAYDGWIDPALIGEFGTEHRPTSVSSLESWFSCPFGFFLRYLLGVQPVRYPERELVLDPTRHGTLLHNEMERIINAIDIDDPLIFTPASVQTQLERSTRNLEQDLRELRRLGLGGMALLATSEVLRIRAELRRLLRLLATAVDEYHIDRLVAELGFGDESPCIVELNDGGRLVIRGRVDLVGLSQGTPRLIVDYKSGSDVRYSKVADGNPTGDGGHYQLALYALAVLARSGGSAQAQQQCGAGDLSESVQHRVEGAMELVAEYWFALRKRRRESSGFKVTGDVLSQSVAEVTRVLSLIRGGFFVPHSTHEGTCPFCEPYGLRLGSLPSVLIAKHEDTRVRSAFELVFRPLVDAVQGRPNGKVD